jgi:hypothetical protein
MGLDNRQLLSFYGHVTAMIFSCMLLNLVEPLPRYPKVRESHFTAHHLDLRRKIAEMLIYGSLRSLSNNSLLARAFRSEFPIMEVNTTDGRSYLTLRNSPTI